ncbi:MAG: uroporphyrinogen decarboxylase family protein [Planctomycetota bacterium]
MTGKENYTRAVEFGGPERLPVEIAVDLNWMQEKDEAKAERIRELQSQFVGDVFGAGVNEPARVPGHTEEGVTRWVDHWGTGWENEGFGAKTEAYPLADGYHRLAGHEFPDAYAPERFENVDAHLANRGEKYVRVKVWFTLFERLWMLRGFENMLMDPYVEKRNFCWLRDKVLEYELGMIDQWIARDVDGIFFSDDWGCQRGLLMNPDDWRKFYKPAYRTMFARVRAGGAHVWMHLCGNVTAIIPDLVDLGLNVLNPVQPQAMDAEALSRDFGGKLCFNGGLDVQGVMINGTPEDVKSEVHRLVDLFGRFDGGYIGGTSHTVMPETPLDNAIAMYEAFLEHHLGGAV